MKQEDLAGLLGATQSSVSGWINGKYEPAPGTVFTIERCLGVEPGALSRPLGYLPVEPAASTMSVEGAIAESPLLDDEDKVALAGMYRALTRTRRADGERPGRQIQAANRPRSVAGGR